MDKWEAVDYHNSSEVRCIRSNGKPIADVYNHFGNVEENARLIAAAPRLLKELKKYCNNCKEEAKLQKCKTECNKCSTHAIFQKIEG
ncbi:MAG: hypothetical protein ACOCQR_01685 [bacterium]